MSEPTELNSMKKEHKSKFYLAISAYLCFGLFSVNFIVFLANHYTSGTSKFHTPYLWWIPSIIFFILIYYFLKKVHIDHILKTIILAVSGILHGIITQLFFIEPSVIITACSLTLSSLVGAIFFFNRFSEFEIDLQWISENNADMKIIEIIHHDINYWMDLFIKVSYWGLLGVTAAISILYTIAAQEIAQDQYPAMILLYSVFLLLLFVYGISGIIVWMFMPLYGQARKVRDIIKNKSVITSENQLNLSDTQ